MGWIGQEVTSGRRRICSFLALLAGIPLTSGFIGKFSLFQAAYETGNIAVVVVGVLASAVAAFFYLRIVVLLFFTEPTNDTVTVVIPSIMTSVAITISALVTVILGVYPSLLLNTAQSFANFLK